MFDCGYNTTAISACPNECSNHGTCSANSAWTCTCWEGYKGHDCSERESRNGRMRCGDRPPGSHLPFPDLSRVVAQANARSASRGGMNRRPPIWLIRGQSAATRAPVTLPPASVLASPATLAERVTAVRFAGLRVCRTSPCTCMPDLVCVPCFGCSGMPHFVRPGVRGAWEVHDVDPRPASENRERRPRR